MPNVFSSIHDFDAEPVPTSTGGRVVAAEWFHQGGSLPTMIGMVLVVNAQGEVKHYVGSVPARDTSSEDRDARHVAEWGAKLPVEVARALWPQQMQRLESEPIK